MSWTKNDLHDLQLAGRIAKLTLDQVEKIVKPGMEIGRLFDIIEATLLKKADLAFPPNISLDSCAAHDTAAIHEKRLIKKKSLVKVDIGANVNGMLSDTSRTLTMDGKHGKLIKASKKALDEAIKVISSMTNDLAKGEASVYDVLQNICKICQTMRSEGLLCEMHKEILPGSNRGRGPQILFPAHQSRDERNP